MGVGRGERGGLLLDDSLCGPGASPDPLPAREERPKAGIEGEGEEIRTRWGRWEGSEKAQKRANALASTWCETRDNNTEL